MRWLTTMVIAAGLLVIGPAVPALPWGAAAQVPGPIRVQSRDVATILSRADETRIVALPLRASHVALRWNGNQHAAVRVSFSQDGLAFTDEVAVAHDEAERDDLVASETFSGVMLARGARYVRLSADRVLGTVRVVAINATAAQDRTRVVARGWWRPRSSAGETYVTSAAVEQPPIVSRAGWGADESLRFSDDPELGTVETWPAEFWPVQKLTVHHTAGLNDDPDPAATVRAIYHLQAIDRGWGDIGYNFLIDEAGTIYEGRHSRDYADAEAPTGENDLGESVTGAHVGGYNAGNVGVALLGTLSTRDATPAARAALEWLLAWKAERHAVDPLGGARYMNPVTGSTRDVPNISGHRDWAATLCPGGMFYSTLPSLRQAIQSRISGEPPSATVPGPPLLAAARPPGGRGVRLTWTVPDTGGAALTELRVLRKRNGRWIRIASLAGGATAYRDRSTTRGRTYTYVVRAVNTIGLGPPSSEASARAR